MSDNDLLDKYGLLPKSNAPIKAQTEGDELLSKYGLTPVEEVPQDNSGQKWWQGLNNDHSYEGVAKRFGIGLLRGAKDVLDTGAHGLGNAASFVADKVLPESVANKIKQSVEQTKAEDVAGRNAFDKEYPSADGLLPTAAGAGRLTGQVLATAPVMPARAIEGVAAASNALPTVTAAGAKIAAPLANRLVSAAGQGAIGGATLGATTASTNDKSLAENVGEGTLAGGLTGPLLPVASSVGKGVGSALTSSISPEKAALARKAAQYGIDIDAGQLSNSHAFKKFNQVSGWLPFSGAQKFTDKQIGQYTKAVSNTFGEDAANITPEVLKAARKRIGNDYETVGRNTTVNADNQLVQDLSKVYHQADLMLNDQQMSVFQKHLLDLTQRFQNGQVGGDIWQHARRAGEPLSKAINNNAGTDLGDALKGLKVSMDSAFKRSAPQDMYPLLQQADKQYANMKTIEKLALNDPEGQVSPLRLMSKVVNSPNKNLRTSQLGDLAEIGRSFFPTPADSGTPLGEIVADKIGRTIAAPISGALAAAHGLASGGFILPTIEGASGLAANRAVRSALNSKVVQKAILNKAEGNTYGALDKLTEKAVPYSAQLDRKGDLPKRIYITGKSKLPVAEAP